MTRVPFRFDRKEGLVTVHGDAFLDGADLVIETRPAVLNLVPLGARTYRIPADDIERIEVEASVLRKARLVVRPFTFAHIDGFPGESGGEIMLPLARAHRGAAQALVREARLRNLPR